MQTCTMAGAEAAAARPVPDDDEAAAPAAAREPDAGPSAWALKLVDLKGVAKPPCFDGVPATWSDFKFKFVAVAELLGLGRNLAEAQRWPVKIQMEILRPDMREKGVFLFNLLVQVCSGKALAILKLIQPGNGFEGWRALCKEFEPVSSMRCAAMLAGLLTPKSSTASSLAELGARGGAVRRRSRRTAR